MKSSNTDDDPIERRKKYFSERSEYCPETKIEMQEVMEEIKNEKENTGEILKQEKKERQLFMRYYNHDINNKEVNTISAVMDDHSTSTRQEYYSQWMTALHQSLFLLYRFFVLHFSLLLTTEYLVMEALTDRVPRSGCAANIYQVTYTYLVKYAMIQHF